MPVGELLTVPAPLPPFVTVSVYCGTKFAVTVVAAVTVTTHVPVPLHPPPDHPVKREPGTAVAVNVTAAPVLYFSVQSVPHVMPAGELLTVPAPVPLFATVSVYCGTKVAVTVVSAVMVTTHVPVPLHPPPDQPVNAMSAFGVAVNVTAVPVLYFSAQSAPHVMPAGELLTEPVPDPPAALTVNMYCFTKVAVTVVSAVIVTAHVPVPAQPPPDQPVKIESITAAAVSVTDAPSA